MKAIVAIGIFVAALGSSPEMQASGVNSISGTMPSRLSVNVTTTRQSQGLSFGEKVNARLPAAGAATGQGASQSIMIECGQAACVVALPGGEGYRADLPRRRVEVLKSNKTGDPNANRTAANGKNKVEHWGDPHENLEGIAQSQGTAPVASAGGLGQGAALLGGALGGNFIVSAAVTSVGGLAGGGAAAASYAASGRAAASAPIDSRRQANGDVDLLTPLEDGDYLLTLVVEKATSGLKDTLKTNVRAVAPQKVQIVLVFGVEAGVLKTRHDTARNSVSNLR